MRWHTVAPLLFVGLAPQWTYLVDAQPTEECPILGPTFPRDFDLVQTEAFQEATSIFPILMDELLASGRINESTATIYIDVFSTVTNESIYSYSNAASAYTDGLTAGVLNEDTIFRIGSVSKLVTMYAIIVRAGGLDIFNHPVTWYLPELLGNEGEDPLERLMWQDITVGALATQMGGTGSFNLAAGDFACWFAENCTIASFLDLARSRRRPVIPPFETALYSDFGYGVLGRVLERLTNMPFDQALQMVLAESLNLTYTATVEPTGDDVNAFIVPGNLSVSSWGFDQPQVASSGGVYSNAGDLRKLGIAIMNSELLDPLTTREWLKPRTHTADLFFSIGAPWEIYRLDLPVSVKSTSTRVSDLYTKSGGNAGYGSIFGLSPDHGMGFSINVAGDGALRDRWPLRDLVVNTFIPAVEQAGAENARANFAGLFVADDSTNMTLSVGGDSPAIGMESLYLDGIESRSTLAGNPALPPANVSTRFYPTGLVSSALSTGNTSMTVNTTGRVERHSFRAASTVLPALPPVAALGGMGLISNRCAVPFFTVDSPTNATTGFAFDDFVFEVIGGRLERVQSIGAGIWFERAE